MKYRLRITVRVDVLDESGAVAATEEHAETAVRAVDPAIDYVEFSGVRAILVDSLDTAAGAAFIRAADALAELAPDSDSEEP